MWECVPTFRLILALSCASPFLARVGAVREFSDSVYGRLDQRTKVDEVLTALRAIPDAAGWVSRGHIPAKLALAAAHSLGSETLGELLVAQGIAVGKPEPRTCRMDPTDLPRSHRCFILTPQGRRTLVPPDETATTEYDKTTTRDDLKDAA